MWWSYVLTSISRSVHVHGHSWLPQDLLCSPMAAAQPHRFAGAAGDAAWPWETSGVGQAGGAEHGLPVLSAAHPFVLRGEKFHPALLIQWSKEVEFIRKKMVYDVALVRGSSILTSCISMMDCLGDKASTRGFSGFLFLVFFIKV